MKRADPKTKGKQRPKVKIRRQTYTSELKSKATAWKLVYGMKLTAIQKKLKDEYGIEVAMLTLYNWVSNRKKLYLLGGIQIKDLTLNRDQIFL